MSFWRKVSFLVFLFSQGFSLELSQMSLEQKVGQMFMTYFEGRKVNKKAKKLIKEARIGGIIFYSWANELSSPGQVKKLSENLQKLSYKYTKLPLFLGIDQEGGVVTRLKKGFTCFPGNLEIGKTQNSDFAKQVAKAIGEELRAVGINLNFAPVVDVNNNPFNQVMQKRSFGSDPELVAEFAEASLLGYEESGVLSCLKHFPGHGDTNVDSHINLPVVDKSLRKLFEGELIPYQKLCSKVPFVMTSHILFPQIDPENCATFSSFFLQEVLRKQLGFSGIIITDSLLMGGAQTKPTTLLENALQAIEAGNDILLLGGRVLEGDETTGMAHIQDVIAVVKGVIKAVQKGKIAEKRIHESVQRILLVKEELSKKPKATKKLTSIQKEHHLQLAKEILSKLN